MRTSIGDLDFSRRQVIVIGGSSGIGNGIAHSFRQRGAAVHVTGTKATEADYAGLQGSDLEGLAYSRLDVSDPESIDRFALTIEAADSLILSQGLVVYKRGEFEREGWEKVINVNLSSLMHCARAFKPQLAQSQGSLILISSMTAFMSSVGNPAYAASKAGAVSLTKTLGEAWAADHIRVNGIAPGIVETKLTAITTEHPQRREATLASIPLKRFGRPDDVAGVALFLASPLSAYIVGQTLLVDGGMSLS